MRWLYAACAALLLLFQQSVSAQALPRLNVKTAAVADAVRLGGTPGSKVGSFTTVQYRSVDAAKAASAKLTTLYGPQSATQDMVIPIPAPIKGSWRKDGMDWSAQLRTANRRTAGNAPAWLPFEWAKVAMNANVPLGKGTKVKVAVIDSGLADEHPNLKRVAKSIHACDGMPGGDAIGHGSHVTGIIGADGRNGDVSGIADGAVEIGMFRAATGVGVMSDSTVSDEIRHAVDWGARIINLSLGRPIDKSLTPVMEEAINYALSKGVIVVAAAGNSSDATSKYVPASFPGVIAVAAVHKDGIRADFSNYGVSDGAPGVDIISTVPFGYMAASGTSMASPCWAAAAALVLYKHPDWTRDQVVNRIRETADAVDDWQMQRTIRTPNVGRALGISTSSAIFGYAIDGLKFTSASFNLGEVNVTVSDAFHKVVAQTVTDASGLFRIPVKPGLYNVEVTKPGFFKKQFQAWPGPNSTAYVGMTDLYPVLEPGKVAVVVSHTTMQGAFTMDPAVTPIGTAFETRIVPQYEELPGYAYGDYFADPGAPGDSPIYCSRSAFNDELPVSAFVVDPNAGILDFTIQNLWFVTSFQDDYFRAGSAFASAGLTVKVIRGNLLREYRLENFENDAPGSTWHLVLDPTTGMMKADNGLMLPVPDPGPSPDPLVRR